METTHDTRWEQSLEQLARRYEYPPTPELATGTRRRATGHSPQMARAPFGRRRLAWALVLIALVAVAMLAVPQTRAAVLSFFARLGAIDVMIDEAAPAAPLPTAGPGTIPHSMMLFEVGEPVTLDEARRLAEFDIALPAVLGEPDEAYAHRNVDLPAVTLVWRDAGGAALSLTQIGIGRFAVKMIGADGVKWVQIDDEQTAAWLEGPHHVQLFGYEAGHSLPIDSNVLIWTAGDVTYRLEGPLGEEEMIGIARSVVRE